MLTDRPILCDCHEQEWRVLGGYLLGTITVAVEDFDTDISAFTCQPTYEAEWNIAHPVAPCCQ